MRGHIQKRGKSWRIKVTQGRDPATGKVRQKWFTYPTRQEAEAALSLMLTQIHGGGTVPTTRITVAAFLEDWLAKYASNNVRETTFPGYRDIVRRHLIPAVGAIPLRGLSPFDVQGYYTAKLNGDPPTGIKATATMKARRLSPSTVHKHAAVLHKALEDAVKWGLLAANVCDRVDAPAQEKKEPRRWDVGQVKRFMGEVKHTLPHRIYTIFLTLRVTGIRPGEALGLREPDVDLLTGAITIRQKFYHLCGSKRDREPAKLVFGPPKTKKGLRVIEIPPDLVEALRTVMAENARLRREFGSQYADLGEHGPLVFCTDDGRPLDWRDIARRSFRRIVTRLKLPVITPYEFGRHAHAAWLYEQNVHPKIISQRLGHSSVAFTMDTYGYLDRGLQAPVVAKLQEWLDENTPK